MNLPTGAACMFTFGAVSVLTNGSRRADTRRLCCSNQPSESLILIRSISQLKLRRCPVQAVRSSPPCLYKRMLRATTFVATQNTRRGEAPVADTYTTATKKRNPFSYGRAPLRYTQQRNDVMVATPEEDAASRRQATCVVERGTGGNRGASEGVSERSTRERSGVPVPRLRGPRSTGD